MEINNGINAGGDVTAGQIAIGDGARIVVTDAAVSTSRVELTVPEALTRLLQQLEAGQARVADYPATRQQAEVLQHEIAQPQPNRTKIQAALDVIRRNASSLAAVIELTNAVAQVVLH